MINDILCALDPTRYCENVFDLFFPQSNTEDEIVLSKNEKKMIVDQINDVKNHLNIAKRHIAEENFDKAIGEVENAIKSSTCSRCQKKMLISAYDIKHAKNVCELDSGRCAAIKQDIDGVIKEFVENYLPRVEDVLSAREKQ